MSATQDKLKRLFDYDETTGVFVRKVTTNHMSKEGTVAGTKNARGYLVICVEQKLYLAHRLAWLYVYGKWPELNIDHIDGVKTNNAIKNLRDVSQEENIRNIHASPPHNKVGFMGVYKNRNKFTAKITRGGVRHNLGIFLTPEEAGKAYVEAKRKFDNEEMKELK